MAIHYHVETTKGLALSKHEDKLGAERELQRLRLSTKPYDQQREYRLLEASDVFCKFCSASRHMIMGPRHIS